MRDSSGHVAEARVAVRRRPRLRPVRLLGTFAGHVALLACWILVALMAALTWGPHMTKYRTDIILSGSMEPKLPVYSVIVVEPVQPAAIRAGDVITFQQPDNPSRKVTHRVAKVERLKDGRPAFVTKGDNNDVRDPWRVTYEKTGFRVRTHAPRVGWLLIQAQTPMARVLLVALPVLLMLVSFLRWVWRGDEEDGDEAAGDDAGFGELLAMPSLDGPDAQEELPWELEPWQGDRSSA